MAECTFVTFCPPHSAFIYIPETTPDTMDTVQFVFSQVSYPQLEPVHYPGLAALDGTKMSIESLQRQLVLLNITITHLTVCSTGLSNLIHYQSFITWMPLERLKLALLEFCVIDQNAIALASMFSSMTTLRTMHIDGRADELFPGVGDRVTTDFSGCSQLFPPQLTLLCINSLNCTNGSWGRELQAVVHKCRSINKVVYNLQVHVDTASKTVRTLIQTCPLLSEVVIAVYPAIEELKILFTHTMNVTIWDALWYRDSQSFEVRPNVKIDGDSSLSRAFNVRMIHNVNAQTFFSPFNHRLRNRDLQKMIYDQVYDDRNPYVA